MIKANLYDLVSDYVENEINYIKREMSICGYGKSELSDLMMLTSLTEEDVEKIVDSILINYELEDTINNMIHECIYG